MKKRLYMALAAVACLSMPALMSSCEQTDAERDEDATPVVEYVRVTNPEQADSLLVAAPMGSQIVLMGHGLGDVQEIWFNDVKGKLNPTLITSFSIIVDVPSVIPTDVTNEIKLVTSKGNVGVYPFTVTVPAPFIESISCEYAKSGDEITITGDYFLDPQVFFTGAEAEAEIVSFDQHSITLVVPEGVVEGPVSVKSIHGTTKTKFNFLDTNGLITNFDDGYVHPWGDRAPVATDPEAVSGQYLLFEGTSAAWNWSNPLMWAYWASAPTAKGEMPVATGDINNLALKFEYKIDSWLDVPMAIFFTKYEEQDFTIDASTAQYHWKPWLKAGEHVDAVTEGWRTATLPLVDFKYNKDESKNDGSIGDISEYTDLCIMFFGACEVTAPLKIKIDNLRVVTIK